MSHLKEVFETVLHQLTVQDPQADLMQGTFIVADYAYTSSAH